ncbi:MAG: sensor domain-containing diguanylate cyclase [Natronospirillum sp.]|uniref:sensor domain-containing diguanylate cyclase n=1 Tax=Natronospirillum sp. TaxID=2812955 RepID=UPI0025F7BC14|nr:sensor domain-containing diguanylate cyclase [Natronospirillum sp.]MCH8552340.1 sensor domain-containing diguanylate cyclase [Natronospirillum sp.]
MSYSSVVFTLFLLALATVLIVLWLRYRSQQTELHQFRHLADSAHDLIWIIDTSGRFVFVSSSVERMLGYRPEDVIGQPLDMIASHGSATASYHEIRHVLVTRTLRFPRTELKYIRRDGTSLWVEVMINLRRDASGQITGFYGIARDIDEQYRLRHEMHHLAHHDNLTNLPNRTLFFDRLESALSRARRHGWQVALLYMDLDHFKQINDQHGHQEGDRVLKVLARRLAESLREEDTVARIGGDEFSVIIEHLQTPSDLNGVIEKLRQSVQKPIVTDHGHYKLDVSIGKRIIDPEPQTHTQMPAPETLLAEADHDMYQQKAARRRSGEQA